MRCVACCGALRPGLGSAGSPEAAMGGLKASDADRVDAIELWPAQRLTISRSWSSNQSLASCELENATPRLSMVIVPPVVALRFGSLAIRWSRICLPLPRIFLATVSRELLLVSSR